ncbi:MAG: sterol desaturase family protein [Polyangiaceae bacterium]
MVKVCLFTLAGALTWSFLEYLIHRFLGHYHRRNPFAHEHIRHHAEGDYFAPTWKKLIAALGATAIMLPPAMLCLGPGNGGAYVAGFVGFYGVYELLHRREHTHAGIGAYGRWARRHHFTHHFTDARFNHGVTSPIWDFVFGTYKKPSVIVVPRKLCMTWLKDELTGDIKATFAANYRFPAARASAK